MAPSQTHHTFAEWKEKGNNAFKENDWNTALECYISALHLAPDFSPEKAVILKNRAAVYLKLDENKKAVNDCDASLEIVPEDPKALFRRCQALEKLGRYEEAYRDARLIHKVDPSNKAIQPILSKLHTIVEERMIQFSQTENKIKQMFNYVFNLNEDTEKRTKAASNLLVLAKEGGGGGALMQNGVCEKIAQLMKVEQNHDIVLGCIRTLGQLCKDDVPRAKQVVSILGIPWFLDILNRKNTEEVNAGQYCIQLLLNTLSGIDKMDDDKKVDTTLFEQNKTEIETILTCLVYSVTSRSISGIARDAMLQLLSRNVHYKAINWAEELVKIKGLQRLMEVASELPEYKYESAMEITESTRAIVSVCLTRIYENMYYDQARAKYLENVDDFIKGKLITPEIESKVRVVVALTALLLGPVEVGNTIIARDGIMEMILVMAGTEEVLQQKVACECIIAAATKKDKVKSIISQGVNILKRLYASKDDSIRVRALVGLCKLGSSGGTDASIRPFADGATTRLAEACRRFLINPNKDLDLRRWAAEGLSYLTLDADVKEKLVEDKPALRALFELGRSGNQSCVYGVVTTLVNLVNAYEKEEVMPELLELAKFAKHHVPQDHELDDPDFIAKRCICLTHEGAVSALVALSSTDSFNSKELICRIFNSICGQEELRGIVVQQGGVKALLNLAHEGNPKGKLHAAQALSRIGITINPEVAFPGQRCMEVIRPLIALLHPECSALQNFEALLALCNLASVSESVRCRIVKEKGLTQIESYIYENHEELCRAATQTITNLVCSPEVVKIYEEENDRTKLVFLLCGEEDEETVKAAAGAVAILTSSSKKCCKKLFKVNSWLDNLHRILAHPNLEIQHRAVVIVHNIISCSKELAEKIMETDIMEILMAYTLIKEDNRKKINSIADECLQLAKKWNIIKAPGEDDDED
jgi:tetratricopeptide (TPR) repeat protein